MNRNSGAGLEAGYMVVGFVSTVVDFERTAAGLEGIAADVGRAAGGSDRIVDDCCRSYGGRCEEEHWAATAGLVGEVAAVV